MTETAKAIAAAYADAAKIIKELADEQISISMVQYATGIEYKSTEWASKQLSLAHHDLNIRAKRLAYVERTKIDGTVSGGYHCDIANTLEALVSETAMARANALKEAADIIANLMVRNPISSADKDYTTGVGVAYDAVICHAIHTAAVTADPALIGVKPWTPPEDRPYGFRCLAGWGDEVWVSVEWTDVQGSAGSWCDVEYGLTCNPPLHFAPLPTVKGDGDE